MNEEPKPRGGRRPNGTFAPGTSGNPGGRFQTGFGEFTRLARGEGANNLAKLRALRDDPNVPHAVQLNAIKELNDRAYGRPLVPVLQGGVGSMDMLGEPGMEASTPLTRHAKHTADKEREQRRQQVDQAREDMRKGLPVPAPLRLMVAVRDEPE
jgi:hypothetical protein